MFDLSNYIYTADTEVYFIKKHCKSLIIQQNAKKVLSYPTPNCNQSISIKYATVHPCPVLFLCIMVHYHGDNIWDYWINVYISRLNIEDI